MGNEHVTVLGVGDLGDIFKGGSRPCVAFMGLVMLHENGDGDYDRCLA